MVCQDEKNTNELDCKTNCFYDLCQDGTNCWCVLNTNRAKVLIDGDAYFRAVVDAISRAKHSVFIIGWDIDSQFEILPRIGRRRRLRFAGLLKRALRRQRKLNIYLLIWDLGMVFALERKLLPMFKSFWRHHRRLHYCPDSRHPLGACHHQKIIVVDDSLAFVGGIDLTKRRWDTSEHLAHDKRRKTVSGEIYPPHHDVQLAVNGEAARRLAEYVRWRWQRVTGEYIPSDSLISDYWPLNLTADFNNVAVAISRTQPAYGDDVAVYEVANLYSAVIRSATKYIYIENQYLTAAMVVRELSYSLNQITGPDVIIILPRESSGWLESVTIGALRNRALRELHDADRYRRLRIYYPIVPDLGEKHINVHSKLFIADDAILRVGSANLSNRSFTIDTECDLAIVAKDCNQRAEINEVLVRLLAEHLGSDLAVVREKLQAHSSVMDVIEELRGNSRTLVPIDPAAFVITDSLVPEIIVDPEKHMAPRVVVDYFLGKDNDLFPRYWRILIFLSLVIAGLLLWQWETFHVLALFKLPGNWLYWFGGLGGFVLGAILFIPYGFLICIVVWLLGFWDGFGCVFSGIILSATLMFYLGRILGRNLVSQIAGRFLNRIGRKITDSGIVTMIVVHILPVAPYGVINLVAGAVGYRYREFVFGTLIGMLPSVMVIMTFAWQLQNMLRQPTIVNILLLAFISLVVIGGAFGVRKWLHNKALVKIWR